MIYVRIMRGPPGSGKSYYAENCVAPPTFDGVTIINSADYYFIKNGIYRYIKKKGWLAHKSCKSEFVKALQNAQADGLTSYLIVVDNTNTRAREIKFYYNEALKVTDDIQILEISPAPGDETSWVEDCGRRCQHGVPVDQIERMYNRIVNSPLRKEWQRVMIERHDGYFIRKDKCGDIRINVEKTDERKDILGHDDDEGTNNLELSRNSEGPHCDFAGPAEIEGSRG